MKKLIIPLILSLTVFSARAQTSINPKIGLNFTTLATEVASSDLGSYVGFNMGADLRFKKKESWFYLQPGVHYYSVGIQPVTEGTTQEEMEQIPSVNSLKLPLVGGMYLTGSDGLLKIKVNAGITPTVVMGVENNHLGIEKSDFRGAALGLSGGLGIEVLFVTLDLNYEHGLSNVYQATEGAARTFSISAGIKIP